MELLELVFGLLELICDIFGWLGERHENHREKQSRNRPSSTRPSKLPMPDSNRIATSHGDGPASMPYPYTEFDQWHSM